MSLRSICTPYIICFALLLNFSETQAQQEGELDKRSGFKDIKLGQPLDSVRGVKLKKEFKEADNVNPSKLYEIEHPDYSMIGEIKVHKIEVKTYRDLVYEIKVTTEKDPRLMKAMESVYGPTTYDAKNIRYFWKSDKMILNYESISKKELLLEYRSFTVPKMMSDDKAKKIENIANDF
ncbi:MAG TPA: hypothetical protein VFW11_20810 [Cyclobacteriaceae bacterium]|nr:hypothetical protein [Cyclobacteriaceae bacterium]